MGMKFYPKAAKDVEGRRGKSEEGGA